MSLNLFYKKILMKSYFQKLFKVGQSFYNTPNYNLSLPETQTHTYHLFDEQEIYNKKTHFSVHFSNGFSVAIPILLSISLFFVCFYFVNYMWKDLLYVEAINDRHSRCPTKHTVYGFKNYLFYLIVSIWILFIWFENIRFENKEGFHNSKVNHDYKLSFILFLGSEVMFFFSIFWAFFHFSVGSSLDIGYVWPPVDIETISYLNLPLLNTLILITSGIFVTWSHNGLKLGDYDSAFYGLLWTIILGLTFLMCQMIEYLLSDFSFNDSVFGSIFFFGTGFHGMHVLLGTIALIYNFNKLYNNELSSTSHYSFLFTIWYWHFVDIIWLFLYLIFYIWGQ